MNYIYILEIEKVKDLDFERLSKDLEDIFGFEIKKVGPTEMPDFCFDEYRNQYKAVKILDDITKLGFANMEKILGITDKDLFAEGYTYIFGQAESPGKASVISSFRLDPRNMGKIFNPDLFYERMLKEAIHELGHNFGMSHCPDRTCPMYFSNNLIDTDFKEKRFCNRCMKLLKMSK